MPDLPDYHWPPMGKRRVMGKPMNRLDGIAKSTGAAKYSSDRKPEGMLYGALLTSPHAHAKVTSIDTSAAEKLSGVEAVRVVAKAGTEIQWAGAEVAFVAARTEEIAEDALRLIKVDYEVLPHLVNEEDLSKVGSRGRAVGEQVTGDPDKAFKEADAVSEGHYGIPVLTHCCLESHGQTIAVKGDHVEYYPSTQNVYGIATDIGRALNIPVSNVHVNMDYMGGGFGSKFPADVWGVEAAKMSQSSGKPVRLFLDRATELTMAGNRPSVFANVKVAAKRDGTITSWQSQTWSTGGIGGGNLNAGLFPYVFTKVPNRRINHTSVSINAGGARAWRAPNHPQVCFVTCSALEDLAAKLNMDPLEMFLKNLDYTSRADLYKFQFAKAAELMEWKKNWHPRGDSGSGSVKRGLGLALGTWGGAGHASTCKTTIHPDASVEVELATQDLGTGSRTMVAMIAAETFGLPVSAIKVKIGDNSYPNSGGSGGSTTSGGISSSTRKSTVNALQKLFEVVAQSLNVPADQLEAVDGRIRVKGNPDKGMSFQQAAQKLGVNSISEMGENNPRNAPKEGLNTGGTGGVQMADVSVDIDTGIVKMNRMVAVQDCGLVVNPKTAESQVFGACIMSVCGALYEERIMDQQIGRVLNPDMEFYKLAGIGDVGEIIVHMDIREENDSRGVIGLGEPCAIGGLAAIANAVANAIGVRVPRVPLTPARVLAALERRTA
ncbi:MAG: xanthine dehydrogenase family protein molybdopterin-binding subunit [Acidobacteriia bacterium]|nr:xanthine dehydrogenase family protein molybdopterin-binding subunit [Terriglobia bacterium]